MKIKRSARLGIVLELAEREERRATEQVHTWQARLHDEQQRLLELKSYYEEYEEIFRQRRGGIKAYDIARERQFLIELTNMQVRQRQQIALVEKGLEKKLELWRECHLKHQSLENLIARIQGEENAELDKVEQKLLDEWFARASLKRVESKS